VVPSAQILVDGKRMIPKKGQSVPYVEKRYRFVSTTGPASFMENERNMNPSNFDKFQNEKEIQNSDSNSGIFNSRNLGI